MYTINVLSKSYLQNPFNFLSPALAANVVGLKPFGVKGLTRYQDLRFVYERHDLFTSDAMDSFMTELRGTGFNPLGQPLVALDGAQHLRLKKSLGRAMKQTDFQHRIETYSAFLDNWMDQHANTCIDSIRTFFTPFVYFVSSGYLGLKLDDLSDFVEIALSLSTNSMSLSEAERAIIVQQHLAFKKICEDSLNHAPTGTIAGGLQQEVTNGAITTEEALDLFRFIFYASTETTRKFLPTLFYFVDQQQIDYQQILNQSKLYNHEFLRLFSPAQFSIRKVVEQVTTPTGVSLEQGEIIFLFNHYANRDPEAFEHPEQINLQRSNIYQHLGLGKGAHYCLGGGVVEIELNEILKFLIRNQYKMHFSSTPQYKDELFLRGPYRLDFKISST